MEKNPSKSPVMESPPCSPNRVSMERDAPSPEFFYNCQIPQKGALPRNVGKTYGHHSQSPTQKEGLRTMGCGLVPPRGSLTTLLSLPQCCAAFSMIPSTMTWVD